MFRPVSTGRADSGGVRIAWYRSGSDERTVLMIPTWNLVDARVWRPVLAFLEPEFTVLTYDPRGAGASDRPASGYGFDRHMADAAAVLDANDVERAAIVTASRGINAAVLLAASEPRRVTRICAIAPYMRLEAPRERSSPDEVFAAWRRDWPGWARSFMEKVFSEPDSEATIAATTAIALEASPEILITQETELDWDEPARRLGDVRCPALLIHGAGDLSTPVSVAEDVARGLPDAQLLVLDGAGHRPDIRNPEIVAPYLLEFLRG
jgi:pimeloyl-ACP methyl ester carboxylesterase